jgi:hypothetical protein
MVVALNLDEVSKAIGPTPSDTSLRSLDAVNLLLAGALSGFGPYVAVFLAEQKWTQQNIGFVLTAAGFAGLLTQLPAGVLLDAIRSKRAAIALGATMVAVGALIIAFWSESHWNLHTAPRLDPITRTVTLEGQQKSGPESPARFGPQSSGFEDCHDFHRTRIHDDDLVADHEIVVSAPRRLDGEDRLGNRNEVNRTRHRPSNRHVKIRLIDPRCVPLTCKGCMEASPLLGRNIDRPPDGGRSLTGRTAAIPAIFLRPVLPARLLFSVDRQAIALRVAAALIGGAVLGGAVLGGAVLLALVPRRRLAGSLATAAVLLDLTRAIRARFASLFGGISAAVLGRTILRRRAAIVGSGATRNCARALMRAGRRIGSRSPAWFLLGKSGRSGYQGDRRSRCE